MADKDLTVHLKADDKITPVAKKAAAELKKLEKPIEVTADVTDVLGDLDKVIAEMKQTAAAADVLGAALGPELAGQADLGRVVTELRAMGAEFDEITADADKFAAKLKELADADAGGKLGGALGTARGKTDELADSARGANSAMANMIGNASQDLGALSGVAGSAGVALGQLGEYAADAALGGEKLSSALGSMAKVAGPIAAISAALAVVQTIMGGIKAEEVFEAGLVEDFTAALKDGQTVLQDMYTTMQETGELPFVTGALGGGGILGLGSKSKDLIPIFEELGFSTKQWLDMLADPQGSAERMIAQMEAMGTANVDQQLLMEQAAEGLLSYGDAADKAKLADERRLAIAKELKPVFDEFAGGEFARSTEEQGDAADDAGRSMASYARNIRETAEAARELMGAEQAAADARRAAADSAFAVRDAQRDFNDQMTEWVELTGPESEASMQDLAAAMDATAVSAGSVADAQVQLQLDTMAAAGETQTAEQAQSTWNRSMLESARTASGPLRQSIIDYIAEVNGIPPEKVSEILADTQYDTIEEAQLALDALKEEREAKIVADAETAQAEADLEAVRAKKREAVITVRAVASENAAYGGSNAQRPRSVEPAAMSTYTAAVPAAALAPVTYPITVRVPAPQIPSITIQTGVIGNRFDVDRTVTKALRRHQRLNGMRA